MRDNNTHPTQKSREYYQYNILIRVVLVHNDTRNGLNLMPAIYQGAQFGCDFHHLQFSKSILPITFYFSHNQRNRMIYVSKRETGTDTQSTLIYFSVQLLIYVNFSKEKCF